MYFFKLEELKFQNAKDHFRRYTVLWITMILRYFFGSCFNIWISTQLITDDFLHVMKYGTTDSLSVNGGVCVFQIIIVPSLRLKLYPPPEECYSQPCKSTELLSKNTELLRITKNLSSAWAWGNEIIENETRFPSPLVKIACPGLVTGLSGMIIPTETHKAMPM